jgi:hypothetical protein
MHNLGFGVSYSPGIAMRASPDDTVDNMLRLAYAAKFRTSAQGRA